MCLHLQFRNLPFAIRSEHHRKYNFLNNIGFKLYGLGTVRQLKLNSGQWITANDKFFDNDVNKRVCDNKDIGYYPGFHVITGVADLLTCMMTSQMYGMNLYAVEYTDITSIGVETQFGGAISCAIARKIKLVQSLGPRNNILESIGFSNSSLMVRDDISLRVFRSLQRELCDYIYAKIPTKNRN